MKKYAIIVAGGTGTRMGAGIPKQFLALKGRPMLWWSIKAFHSQDPSTVIIVVLPQNFVSLWEDYYSTVKEEERFPHLIAIGGNSRFESVRNGLELVEDLESLVAVHDGARPLITSKLIIDGWENAEKHGASIPVVNVVDSLRELTDEGSRSVDRAKYVAVQTPQVFKAEILKPCYEKAPHSMFTDDAAVVENAGFKVALFDGHPDNIKVTHSKDMETAGQLLCRNS